MTYLSAKLLIASTVIITGLWRFEMSSDLGQLLSAPTDMTTDVEHAVSANLGPFFVLTKVTDTPCSGTTPFLVGDFNGDGTEDLAAQVALRDEAVLADPEEALRAVSRVAFVGKPLATGLNARRSNDGRIAVRVFLRNYREIPLLLLVHGVRGSGWKGAKVNRHFVLAALGNGCPDRMILSREPLRQAAFADELRPIPPPSFCGDSIRLLDSKGRGEAIYWDGHLYRWYPIE